MQQTKVYNLIVLDESGSMWSIKRQAVDGVNETIQTIRAAQRKHPEQDHYVSLVTFNTDGTHTLHDCAPIGEVSDIKRGDFRPCGGTPLYDAMGHSLNALAPKVEPGDNVLVTIVTDGMENASREFDGSSIKALVDSLKAKDWVFVYIGANQDVERMASTISITNTLRFEATPSGTAGMNARVQACRANLYDRMAYSCYCAADANEDFFD